jgi:hypothetical protein
MTAIIADPRNDENLIVAGLHAAFLLAHNRTVDAHRANRLPGDAFTDCRRTITLHWQWIVVNEFLVQIVGRPLVDDILRNGRRWYKFASPSMPVEFQTGAYRFGHSIVRPSYRANLHGDPGGNPTGRTCTVILAAIPGPVPRRSSGSSSTPPASTRPTRSICAAARGRGGGSSAGRRSSTSAAIRPGRFDRTS